jgi:hypothetical protein
MNDVLLYVSMSLLLVTHAPLLDTQCESLMPSPFFDLASVDDVPIHYRSLIRLPLLALCSHTRLSLLLFLVLLHTPFFFSCVARITPLR